MSDATAFSEPLPRNICIQCGRDTGVTQACQSCRHISGMAPAIHLSSPGRRLGGYILEVILIVLTLGIGWLAWTVFVTASQGQTPAKKLLHMRVVKIQSHKVAGWGEMFLREVIYKFATGVLITLFTFGLGVILYAWLLWDRNGQQLWDKMGATIVVDDPNDQLAL